MITILGLSTCDTTKLALKTLTQKGIQARLRDVRAEPLSEQEIDQIVTEFGDRAVNKQSTTYRGFSAFLKESESEVQIAQAPAVMKRPVITDGTAWTLGWDAAIEARWTA
jgi:arsenate reductase